MKFPKMTALLGFAIQVTSGLFNDKKFVKLDEASLNKIEDHLANSDTTKHQEQITALEQEKATLQETADNAVALTDAVEQALELNALKADTSLEAIVLLGSKCKEYGDSTNRHVTPSNDGKQKDPSNDSLIDGIVNMNDAHNQID